MKTSDGRSKRRQWTLNKLAALLTTLRNIWSYCCFSVLFPLYFTRKHPLICKISMRPKRNHLTTCRSECTVNAGHADGWEGGTVRYRPRKSDESGGQSASCRGWSHSVTSRRMMVRGLTGMKRATIIAMITRKPPNTNGGPGTVSCNIRRHDDENVELR